jgi:hypothetical protein
MIRTGKLLRGANPVTPVAPGAPLDTAARSQLANYVHPSVLVDDAAPASRHPARRWVWLGAAAAGVTAAMVTLAMVLPTGAPPANAQLMRGKVVEAPASEQGAAWSTSAMIELDRPDGMKRVVRVWSRSGGEWAAVGDELVYERGEGGGWSLRGGDDSPLGLLPGVEFDTANGVTSIYSEDVGDQSEGDPPATMSIVGSIGEADYGSSAHLVWSAFTEEEAAAGLPRTVGVVYLPVEVDSVPMTTALAASGDSWVFYAQADGTDPDVLRAALAGLSITPEGWWEDREAAKGLIEPAEAMIDASGAAAAAPELPPDPGDSESGLRVSGGDSGEDGVVKSECVATLGLDEKVPSDLPSDCKLTRITE